jgi:hypothetical protein
VDLPGGCRGGDEAELLKHQEAVEHQVERAMFAVAEAEHLDVSTLTERPVGGTSPMGLRRTPSCVPVKVPSSTATSSMM